MDAFNIMLSVMGGLLLLLGLTSGLVKNRTVLSEPLIALLVGIVVGPAVLDLLNLAHWGNTHTILEQAARLTMAVAVMGVALRLPHGALRRNWKSLALLLGVMMPLMWLVSGLLAFGMLGGSFWVALLIGAVVTPTDPVLANSIVTGTTANNNIPQRLRFLLSSESGANDGLAFLFVLLPILMLQHPPGHALSHWLTHTLLWEVLGAVGIGLLIGLVAGHLQQWLMNHLGVWLEQRSLLGITLALSLMVLGITKLMGSDGILAVFAAGIAMNNIIKGQEEEKQERIQETVERFFVLPIFVLFGMALPWERWFEVGWAGVVLVVAILLLRRLPAMLMMAPLIKQVQGMRDTLFAGWFGPIGVAALFYATLSVRKAGTDIVWVVGSMVIAASVLVHGVTATPFTQWYGALQHQSVPERHKANRHEHTVRSR